MKYIKLLIPALFLIVSSNATTIKENNNLDRQTKEENIGKGSTKENNSKANNSKVKNSKANNSKVNNSKANNSKANNKSGGNKKAEDKHGFAGGHMLTSKELQQLNETIPEWAMKDLQNIKQGHDRDKNESGAVKIIEYGDWLIGLPDKISESKDHSDEDSVESNNACCGRFRMYNKTSKVIVSIRPENHANNKPVDRYLSFMHEVIIPTCTNGVGKNRLEVTICEPECPNKDATDRGVIVYLNVNFPWDTGEEPEKFIMKFVKTFGAQHIIRKDGNINSAILYETLKEVLGVENMNPEGEVVVRFKSKKSDEVESAFEKPGKEPDNDNNHESGKENPEMIYIYEVLRYDDGRYCTRTLGYRYDGSDNNDHATSKEPAEEGEWIWSEGLQ
jgi:hypothetical protein